MENRLSSEMPVEDCANCPPLSVGRKTASERVQKNSSLELLGQNRNDRPASPAVPPMPISHDPPPSVVRLTPPPSVATKIFCALFGSTATSLTTNTGHVPSCSGVQVAPTSVDRYSPTFSE